MSWSHRRRRRGSGSARHGDTRRGSAPTPHRSPGCGRRRCSRSRFPAAASPPAPPGVVQPRRQRVIAKPVLERRRRLLLLRMTGHQGGVHVDHQSRTTVPAHRTVGTVRPASPRSSQGPFAGRRSCDLHLLQQRLPRPRRGPATRSRSRPPARTRRTGHAAPPGRRSPPRRRRASPPDQPTPGPAHAPSVASGHRRPRRRAPPRHQPRRRRRRAAVTRHGCRHRARRR